MLRLAAILAAFAVRMSAADPADLLAKARAAFAENADRARYWNWTTTTSRTILDKNGRALEPLPSVTVESPIRNDGKRCNAVLAWGDGREPYLANASADERCAVEQESRDLLNEDGLLRFAEVKVTSAFTLTIRRNPQAAASPDPARRCIGSLEGRIQLDPQTFFPKTFDLQIAGSGCEQLVPVTNHYDKTPVSVAMTSLRKGSTLHWEYALQKDRSGDASKNYWIVARRHALHAIPDKVRAFIIWGRRFEVHSTGKDRRILIDAETQASELSADALIRFETKD